MIFEPRRLKYTAMVGIQCVSSCMCVYCWDWHNPHSDTLILVCVVISCFLPRLWIITAGVRTLITDSEQTVTVGRSPCLFKVLPVISGALQSSVAALMGQHWLQLWFFFIFFSTLIVKKKFWKCFFRLSDLTVVLSTSGLKVLLYISRVQCVCFRVT